MLTRQYHRSCNQHIRQRQWYHYSPAQTHQLVVPEPWKRPSYPHKEEYKAQYFNEQRQKA